MADFMADGFRYRRQFCTYEEASAWEAELRKRIRLKEPFTDMLETANGDKMTLTALLDKTYRRYWEGGANESTQLGHIKLLEEHFGPTLPIDQIDSINLDTLIKDMERRGLAASTINGRLSALSKALTFAVDRGYLHKKPKIERRKVNNERLRFFTEEEELEILTALRMDGREAFALWFEWSIDTGIRPIESRNIPITAVREDPELGYLVDLRKTKNAHPRTIPLTARAYNAFCQLSQDGKMPFARFTEATIRHNWRFVREALSETDPEFVFYLTRHTCASRLVQRNVPLHVVNKWLGHKTFKMTLRYAKLTPRNFLEAKIALEAAT